MTQSLPLHAACWNNWEKAISLLLAHLPEEQVFTEVGISPIHGSECSIITQKQTHRKELPLHIACQNGSKQAIDILLEYDPCKQVMTKDIKGNIPLHKAVRHGSLAVVESLLEHEPLQQVLQQNSRGNTPLLLACRKNSLEIIQALLRHQPLSQIYVKSFYV